MVGDGKLCLRERLALAIGVDQIEMITKDRVLFSLVGSDREYVARQSLVGVVNERYVDQGTATGQNTD